ncbi:MAG: hypothetical protein WAN43_15260 [Rhodomicrobium sp.]|jgi:hypothetical protein
MRTLALSGLAALAISMMTPAGAWAWSVEPAAPRGADGANLAEADDPLKVLQDKVDAKSGSTSSQSGFTFSGSAATQPFGRYGFRSDSTDTSVPFGYSPLPGFRGPPQ